RVDSHRKQPPDPRRRRLSGAAGHDRNGGSEDRRALHHVLLHGPADPDHGFGLQGTLTTKLRALISAIAAATSRSISAGAWSGKASRTTCCKSCSELASAISRHKPREIASRK